MGAPNELNVNAGKWHLYHFVKDFQEYLEGIMKDHKDDYDMTLLTEEYLNKWDELKKKYGLNE